MLRLSADLGLQRSRRCDPVLLDLFVRDTAAFDQLRRRVRSLTRLGVELRQQHASPDFSRALAVLGGHPFTIDVVIDENLFRVGTGHAVAGVCVAGLQTLLMCKAASLVSRCSEKDLYDLWWMGSQGADLGPEKLVRLGSQIDAGVEAESVLISLTGARPSPSACDFALPGGPTPKTIYRRVLSLKQELEHAFGRYLEQQPPPPLARSLRRLRRLK